MLELLSYAPLALEGQWKGAAAVGVVLTAIAIFMGSLYIILTGILGWRQAYYVLMTSLMGFLILLSLVWLLGAPGTAPGFGPRGREPVWIPFLADSELGQDFLQETQQFPDGWDEPGKKYFGNPDATQTGAIDSVGEIDTIAGIIRPALAGFAQAQKTGSINPDDYRFRRRLPQDQEQKLSEEERKAPVAEMRFRDVGGGRLLFGVTIPGVEGKHPEITVFAFRDKGTIFLPSLYFLIVSVALFALHLWLLARDEVKQRAREAATAGTPVGVSPGG